MGKRRACHPRKIGCQRLGAAIRKEAFVDTALGIVRDHGVSPAHLEFELTESGMMRAPERAAEIAQALTAAGFALVIDDFGTGYSSLAFLKRFPVHKLKIDRSFVRDMLVDRKDHAIVSTIIAMCRSLKRETLAESIEHLQQAEALMALGYHYAQGYHYGRPLAENDFAKAWLRSAGR